MQISFGGQDEEALAFEASPLQSNLAKYFTKYP